LFVVNSTGIGRRKLTDTKLRDESPLWTPDGQHIIFSSNRDINVSSEVYIMKADGGSQTPLTHFIADDIFPVFVP
jgi:Tol biopolymer transport system component